MTFISKKKFINYINNKFKEPITIFDVGAHHGETIELFQKNIHCKKIYSFEASSSNFKKLESNFKNKYSSNIEIFNYAIGEKEKKHILIKLLSPHHQQLMK